MNAHLIMFLASYFTTINLVTFILFGADKYKSKRQKKRISEKTLIIFALIGGTIGSLMAIKMFRHKTKHKKFTIGIPLILIVQIVMAYILIRN